MILIFPAILFASALVATVILFTAYSPRGLRAKAFRVHGVKVS